MGLKGWLFGDFVEKIEYQSSTREIFWKFPLGDREISFGAEIFIDKSQIAVISVGNGVYDIFTYGRYKLDLKTLPNISKELNWQDDHDEPFIADIYFLDISSFIFNWDTKEPILLHDKDDTLAQLIAKGTFKTKISTVSLFLKYITNNDYKVNLSKLFEESLIDAIVKRSSSIYSLGSSKLEFSYYLKSRMVNEFVKNGLVLEEIDVSELDVEQRLPNMANIVSNNDDYYIIKNSQPRGPYTKEKILQMINEQKLIPANYIWKDGLEDWVKVKDLFDVEQ